MDSDNDAKITIRVAGAGINLILTVPPTSTIAQIKEEVERSSSLLASYQRLLARGKKLDDDETTLQGAGILDRSRLMLIHNEAYAIDRAVIVAIDALMEELEELKSALPKPTPARVRERVTQICCSLDGVDVGGSQTLKKLRKKAIERAQSVEKG